MKIFFSRIVLKNYCMTAKYQPLLVQNGPKIPEGLDLGCGGQEKTESTYLTDPPSHPGCARNIYVHSPEPRLFIPNL